MYVPLLMGSMFCWFFRATLKSNCTLPYSPPSRDFGTPRKLFLLFVCITYNGVEFCLLVWGSWSYYRTIAYPFLPSLWYNIKMFSTFVCTTSNEKYVLLINQRVSHSGGFVCVEESMIVELVVLSSWTMLFHRSTYGVTLAFKEIWSRYHTDPSSTCRWRRNIVGTLVSDWAGSLWRQLRKLS